MPKTAVRLIKRIVKAVGLLEIFPERGWKVQEQAFPGCREIVVRRYRILYRIDRRGVQIERILDGSRNLDERTPKDE